MQIQECYLTFPDATTDAVGAVRVYETLEALELEQPALVDVLDALRSGAVTARSAAGVVVARKRVR